MSETQSEIQPERLPFDVDLYRRADEFAAAALASVPELVGIAIVPVWHVQSPDTPPGLLRLRNPQPPHMQQLMQLLKQLSLFSVEVHKDLVGQLQMFGRYAEELAQVIKTRQEQLSPAAEAPATDA